MVSAIKNLSELSDKHDFERISVKKNYGDPRHESIDKMQKRALEKWIKFDEKCRKAFVRLIPLERDFRQFSNITRDADFSMRSRLSNGIAAVASTQCFTGAFIEFLAANPQIKPIFFTFCPEEGVTWLNKADLDLKYIKARCDQLLRALGLHGIMAFEIDVFKRTVLGEKRKRMHLHVHGFVWGIPFGQLQAAVTKLNDRNSFCTSLGLDAIKLRPTQNGTMAFLANYLSEHSEHIKNPVRNMKEPGTYKVRANKEGYTQKMALCILAARHQLRLRDQFFGVGEGATVRRLWSEKLAKRMKRKPFSWPMVDSELADRLFDKAMKLVRTDDKKRRKERAKVQRRNGKADTSSVLKCSSELADL